MLGGWREEKGTRLLFVWDLFSERRQSALFQIFFVLRVKRLNLYMHTKLDLVFLFLSTRFILFHPIYLPVDTLQCACQKRADQN